MINHDNFIIYYCFIIDHTECLPAAGLGNSGHRAVGGEIGYLL